MAVAAKGAHRAAVPLAVGMLLAIVSCTGSDEPGGGSSPSSTADGRTASSAPPGKYRTLPEPCGAVPEGVLSRVLPSLGSTSPGPDGESPTEDTGRSALTYDTDRRVGCEWTGKTVSSDRRLEVDFERVVSYDPAVSDEDQAHEEYLQAAGEADLSATGTGASPGGAEGAEAAEGASARPRASQGPQGEAGGSPGPEASVSDPASGSATPASPRVLSGLGDEAFLHEQLRDTAAEPHRDVLLVFREENVIVRVRLREWAAHGQQLPLGSALQVSTHLVAQELAEELD